MTSRHALTHDELVAFAGLVRVLMMIDRSVSEAEAATAAAFSDRLAELPPPSAAADPYRGAARLPTPLTPTDWQALWSEALRALPNEDEVKEAAAAIERVEAREIVYAFLHELATHESISDPEWNVLEWLDEAWTLDHGDP